jgi:hypothetical protein
MPPIEDKSTLLEGTIKGECQAGKALGPGRDRPVQGSR